MSIISDLQDLRALIEESHQIVSSNRVSGDGKLRASNLLDAARALTDIMIESEPVKARVWKPYWRRRADL